MLIGPFKINKFTFFDFFIGCCNDFFEIFLNSFSTLFCIFGKDEAKLLKFTGGSQAKNLALLPMFHIYGLNGLLNLALLRGHHVITLPRFEPKTFVQTMKTYKVIKSALVKIGNTKNILN